MDSNLLAKALAESDAHVQATFLNEFHRLLKIVCKGRSDNQICYIADELDANGREFAEQLNASAKLASESRVKVENEIRDLWRQKRELETEIAAVRAANEKTQLDLES